MSLIRNLCTSTSGATAIEYGIIVGLIAVIIIGALTLIGSDTSNTFNAVSNGIN